MFPATLMQTVPSARQMPRLSFKMIRRIEEVVAPLRPTDRTGEVFEVDIQQGKLTYDPHNRCFWSEVRLLRQPDGQWHLTYSHLAGEVRTVYRGKLLLDRAWWLTLL